MGLLQVQEAALSQTSDPCSLLCIKEQLNKGKVDLNRLRSQAALTPDDPAASSTHLAADFCNRLQVGHGCLLLIAKQLEDGQNDI